MLTKQVRQDRATPITWPFYQRPPPQRHRGFRPITRNPLPRKLAGSGYAHLIPTGRQKGNPVWALPSKEKANAPPDDEWPAPAFVSPKPEHYPHSHRPIRPRQAPAQPYRQYSLYPRARAAPLADIAQFVAATA